MARRNQHKAKLRTYRQLKTELRFEEYLMTRDREAREVMTRLRGGTNELRIETGRYPVTNRDRPLAVSERRCLICMNGEIEDETHFMLDCEEYEDLRQRMLDVVSRTLSRKLQPIEIEKERKTEEGRKKIMAALMGELFTSEPDLRAAALHFCKRAMKRRNTIVREGLDQKGQVLTYGVLPIVGLDILMFEIIYGRGPNLPIDNILFRENYATPVQTLEEYLDMLHETQLNMYEALNLARKERFERNKKNSSQTPPRLFKPGDKVYLSYPRGRFRPLHGSTKLSRVNDGPFTVLGDMFQGLVYNLKHDRKKTEELASVGRMIPVEEMVLPDQVTDLPVQGLKQFDGERTDRLNDLTQQQAKEKQQELRELEANNEVKDEEKHADVRIAEDIQNMQKTEADKKRKQAQDQAQAIGNPNLLEDEAEGEFRMEVEQDNPEVRQRRLWAPKPKAKAKQVVQQSYDASELRPQHVTNKKDRAERAKEREERKAYESTSSVGGSASRRSTRSVRMVTHGTKKKVYAICITTTCVENTTRERRRHRIKSRHARGERNNFNYIQAFTDIFCRSDDEDEDVELQRKKYSEGVWVEDNCEDSKRPTLQETIEKKNTLSLNICANILSLATGETSNINNRTLNDWSGFPH